MPKGPYKQNRQKCGRTCPSLQPFRSSSPLCPQRAAQTFASVPTCWTIMQHESTRTSPVFLVCDGCAPLKFPNDSPHQNFVESLPTEMSVRIFSELDTESLCSASRTCKLWHTIIEQNEQLWRKQCLLLRAFCQREVDGDRRDGLSWKVTLVRNYSRSCVKRDWLRGRYSCVGSADELLGRRMVPLDAETWGQILQAELDR